MKPYLGVFFAVVSALAAAQSPDSISGTVFREHGGIASLRIQWERTVIFGDDSRYTYVKTASASTIDGNWRIEQPPSDGTYFYTKTGPSTGTVRFSDPAIDRLYYPTGESPVTLTLSFDDTTVPWAADADSGEYSHGGRLGYFTLTKASTLQREALANVSMRGSVSTDRPLIVGFVIRGNPRDVLIRVVGPALRAFGVSEPWANPTFEIYRGGSVSPIGGPPGPRRNAIAYYDDWSADSLAVPGLQKLFAHTGAFLLEVGSRDAVGVTPRMVPGAYTIVCTSGSNDAGGDALVEVYVLP